MKQPSGGENAGDRNSTASKANRPSTLLTNEENDQLFRLLGRRCQTLSTAVVQLYTTQSPAHASWVKRCTGALCFIKDNIRKSYYFRLYCLKANQMVWEQELYEKIEVTLPKPYLITFEGQDGIVAFNFATEDEAAAIMNTTLTTIHNRNRRRDERIKRNNTRKDPPPARPPPLQNIPVGAGGSNIPDTDASVTYRNKQPFASPFSGPAPGPPMQQYPGQQPVAPNLGNATHQKPRKVKGMGKLQKSDIGSPSNFKHVTHVGWDPHSGFDLIGAQESLKPFLEKAGVGDQHLKDRDTCAFIYDFIQTNNVLDTVKSEQSSGRKQKPPAPPPVPHPPSVPSHQNGHTRNPPPPPPHRTLPPLPPTTPPKVVPGGAPPATRPPPMQPPPTQPVPSVAPPSSSAPAPPPPPPPMMTGPVPPPPPPMMMPSLKPPAPAIPGGAGGGGGDDGGGDARSALLDSIRKGTTLKKVDQSTHSTGSGDMRNDLMTEIQQGFQLRPVANRELNAVGERNSGGGGSGDVGTDALADALRRALAERGRVIRASDEDDSDSNSNNTDWED
ncbi:neural Wiskott-Aldrich syndrome protein isoform X2 [Anopheles stephensi]|uniref:neural Wiskott-Aldrich syndrome protein isoform X2 n=1 Tax=Anopheles stephensi TaxID=30069 RepID=UPI001658B2B6|nr:neural Wiskott-Aldrich syndrome protein isoform X2 [Anopheles stephensi]XP_035902450.1 neural Wiskott-Aldrich syndrome protein isoform X2 [Anopheles stephensi]XP_035902458.1 neural Wiskott-Aldrich syndrome protein isoform X2 [Anopheles stephensi]